MRNAWYFELENCTREELDVIIDLVSSSYDRRDLGFQYAIIGWNNFVNYDGTSCLNMRGYIQLLQGRTISSLDLGILLGNSISFGGFEDLASYEIVQRIHVTANAVMEVGAVPISVKVASRAVNTEVTLNYPLDSNSFSGNVARAAINIEDSSSSEESKKRKRLAGSPNTNSRILQSTKRGSVNVASGAVNTEDISFFPLDINSSSVNVARAALNTNDTSSSSEDAKKKRRLARFTNISSRLSQSTKKRRSRREPDEDRKRSAETSSSSSSLSSEWIPDESVANTSDSEEWESWDPAKFEENKILWENDPGSVTTTDGAAGIIDLTEQTSSSSSFDDNLAAWEDDRRSRLASMRLPGRKKFKDILSLTYERETVGVNKSSAAGDDGSCVICTGAFERGQSMVVVECATNGCISRFHSVCYEVFILESLQKECQCKCTVCRESIFGDCFKKIV